MNGKMMMHTMEVISDISQSVTSRQRTVLCQQCNSNNGGYLWTYNVISFHSFIIEHNLFIIVRICHDGLG